MKRILIAIAGLLMITACQETIQERFTREAREFTEKRCPIRGDQVTMIDSLKFDAETMTFHRYMTLEGIADNDSLLTTIDLKDALVKELKNTTAARTEKEAGCSFEYTYYSKSNPGKEIAHILITPEDYR